MWKTSNFKERKYLSYGLSNDKRWSHVLELCKGVKRCGDESENGCACLQPEKVKQEGFANIIAEWQYNSADDEGKVSKESMVLKITPEMVLKLFKKVSDEDVNFMGWSSIWSRPEWMVCTVFPVAPPAMRPSVKHDAQQRSEDDLTHIMINIIKHNNKLKQLIENKDGQNTELNNRVIDDWTSVLQYYVATMVDNKISGAEEPRAKSVKLAIVGFQIGTSNEYTLPSLSFTYTSLVSLVITSIDSMKISALIDMPKNK